MTAEPLIDVGSWPGAEASYWLSGAKTKPTLAVTVTVDAGCGLSGPTGSSQQAAQLAAKYRLICSQLDDPGILVSLLTSLDPNLALPVPDGPDALRRLAAASTLFADAAASARPPALTGIATLGELLDRYGLLADRLAAVNADLVLNSLVAAGQPLAMRTGQLEPDTVPADPSTLAQVAARLGITSGRLLEDNRGLRLATDCAFVLPGIVALPADARTPCLTRDGDALAALARRFGTTVREIVASNADVSGTLRPGMAVEVNVRGGASGEPGEPSDADGESSDADDTVTVSTDTVAGDSFTSLHARLAAQSPGVTLDAVADALDRLGQVLASGAVLSCPLAVLGSSRAGDTAAPLTGAEVHAEHGCAPATLAAANAAVLGLLEPGVQLSIGDRTVSTVECDTLNAVLGRLVADGAAPSIDQLLEHNATVPLFRAGGRAVLPPPPVILTAAPAEALELVAPAVVLTGTLRVERAGGPGPVGGTAGTEPPERADTVVSLLTFDRDSFVDTCLAVLPDVRLALDAEDRLWAVSFGDEGISSVRIGSSAPNADGGAPNVFALRPLYQELVDFSAWIRPMTGSGALGPPVRQHYRVVDVEPWARSFLADLDGYLQPPLSDHLTDAARANLADLRRHLATALPDGLAPLLDSQPDGPPATAALASARAALAAVAQNSLGEAYLASVTAQYPATVVSPYGRDQIAPAWLHGTLQAPGRSDVSLGASRTGLAEAAAWCDFTLTSIEPTSPPDVSIQPRHTFDAIEFGSPSPEEPGTVLARFVRPVDGSYGHAEIVAELPPTRMPLPLREHPAPLLVAAMTAEPTFTGPGVPTLAEAVQWTASLTYTHEHAAQDVITLSWSDPAPAPAAAVSGTALAEALAAYLAVAAELAQLISPDVQPSDEGDGAATVRDTAAASLIELVTAVAAAWSQHWIGRLTASPSSAPTSGYRLRAVYRSQPDGGRQLDRLVVRRASAEDSWPAITLDSTGMQTPLTPGPVTDDTREYVLAAPADPSPLTVRLDWPGLRGAPRPDARVTLTAERNAVLPAGPPIAPEFLLASPAQQLEVARPSLRWSEELPLAGVNLAQALQNAFDAVVGDQPENARLSIEVGYAELVGEHHTVLPVLLVPDLQLAPDSADTVAAQLEGWQRAYKPATAGAQWRVRLAVPSAQQGEPPILVFDQLVYPVTGG